MERPRYVFIGGFVVAAVVAFVAVFGLGVLPGDQVGLGVWLLVLGGASLVVGGWRDSIPLGSREVAWWRFVGFGNALVGLALVSAYLPDLLASPSLVDLALSIVAVVGGLVVFAMGVHTARGGQSVRVRRT
jgi:hypothetical protein